MTKSHPSFGSREEIFIFFLPYMGIRLSWSYDQDHLYNFSFSQPLEATYFFTVGPVVSEKKLFESVDACTQIFYYTGKIISQTD